MSSVRLPLLLALITSCTGPKPDTDTDTIVDTADDTEPDVDTDTEALDVLSAVFDAAGGHLENEAIFVDIPAGALTTAVTIVVTEHGLGVDPLAVTSVFTLEPHGQLFAIPVTVGLAVTGDPILMWSEDGVSYSDVATQVSQGFATVETSAFSYTYAADPDSDSDSDSDRDSDSDSDSDTEPLLECGDGVRQGDEQCDDNDTDTGDGCDADCRVELGWDCGSLGLSCVCDVGYEDSAGACIDTDECVTNTDTCAAVASCENTEGAFTCSCPAGWSDPAGDASDCLPPLGCFGTLEWGSSRWGTCP